MLTHILTTAKKWKFARRKFATKITLYGIFSFHFKLESIQKSFLWNVHSVQETSPFFCDVRSRLTRQTALTSLSRKQPITIDYLSHVTLGLVKCRKQIDCAQIAEPFEPYTVLWAFHTIQRSSFMCALFVSGVSHAVDDPAWGRGTPFPPLLLPCPFTFSSFALYYFFHFSFSHSLYLFSIIVHPIPFYHNSPTPFPGVRS